MHEGTGVEFSGSKAKHIEHARQETEATCKERISSTVVDRVEDENVKMLHNRAADWEV